MIDRSPLRADDLDTLDFARGGGSVMVVAQHARTGAVLMVAGADREALARSLSTGEMHYTSRTRGLWHKGATSGNVQRVEALYADCDRDAVLALVHPHGPACHTGTPSCFAAAPLDQGLEQSVGVMTAGDDALERLDRVIAERAAAADAGASYTRRLLDDRNLRLKKLGEECAELVVACAEGDRDRAIGEAADLYYHMMVALRALGGSLTDLKRCLDARSQDQSS